MNHRRTPRERVIAAHLAPPDHMIIDRGAAVLTVAFLCAMSGLLMGLCLAISFKPALAFVFGVVLAGGAAWYGRGLYEMVSRN